MGHGGYRVVKICYLILAHNNPEHFFRLVDAVATPNSTVLVHIDAKSDISAFSRPGYEDKCTLVTERRAVGWAGFTFVQATLQLLSMALSKYDRHDYYYLLSGADYPLRSSRSIENHLEQNHGAQFINLIKMPNPELGKPIERISELYIDRELKKRHFLTRLVPDAVIDKINKIGIRRDYRSAFGDVAPYGGSTWWALTFDAVQYVFDFISNHPRLYSFYGGTFCPDEGFFQTAICNANRFRIKPSLTFTDWSAGNQPHPAMITNDHIDNFITNGLGAQGQYGAQDYLFARKFPNDSEAMVEKIRRELWTL